MCVYVFPLASPCTWDTSHWCGERYSQAREESLSCLNWKIWQPELSNLGITLTNHINSRISARNSLLWNTCHMLLFLHTSPLRVPEVLFWVNHILNISQNTDLFLIPSGFQSSIYFTANIWSTVPCPSMNSVSVLVSCLWALWQTLSNQTILESFYVSPFSEWD